MAKRFTDTDKWKDEWFTELEPAMKIFWVYICDNCDHAGIWRVNFRIASSMIGAILDKQSALNALGKRVRVISDEKWFIEKFIPFQYPRGLNPTNNAHRGVVNVLNSNNIETRPYLVKCVDSQGAQDKEKDLVKDKDKVKVSINTEPEKNLPETQPQDFRNPKAPSKKFTPDHVVDLWNSDLGKTNGLVPGLGGNKHLHNCLDSLAYLPDAKAWTGLFSKTRLSAFLMGENPRSWRASLFWLVDYDNAVKVISGVFDDGGDVEDLFSKINQGKSV